MVKKYNSKHAFWQALVFTIIVFSIGMMLGFFLEVNRSQSVNENLINSELNIIDQQLRNKVINELNISCDIAIESTFNFADEIYLEASKLESYDAASKFSETLTLLHKRYDLLRALVWTEAIGLRENCGSDFHTVVYLYDYAADDVEINAKQRFYSIMLLELKEAHPDEILLIPIAGDADLESLNLLMRNYGIEELPSIIINEETIITNTNTTLEELEDIIFTE